MIAIIFVSIIGGALVSHAFMSFRRVGRIDNKHDDKYYLRHAFGGLILSFVLVLAVATAVKLTGLGE